MPADVISQSFPRSSERSHTISSRPERFLWTMLTRHPWRVTLVYLSMILAFGAEGFFPYFVKKIVDETVNFGGEIRAVWLWGLGLFGAYLFYAFWLRLSGYLGLKLIVTLKTGIYQRLSRYLTAITLNDEAGKVSKSIALVGEGSEILVREAFWHSTGFLLNFCIHLGLIFSTHSYIFGIFAGWMLLHTLSNGYLAAWRKQYSVRYQKATYQFNGRLVEFTRQRIYQPGNPVNRLSDEMFRLDEALRQRASTQLLDWNISETIHLIYNFIHGLFMILALILILVLWQDKLIGTGDIAMSISIMMSTQKMLKDVSVLMNLLTDAYSQVEAGLGYLSVEQRKGLAENTQTRKHSNTKNT